MATDDGVQLKGNGIMSENKMPSASQVEADKQQKDAGWPLPGDEGFVHPDGTPQSVRQLADNRQAQADRDHAAAVVHGAPLASPGPQAGAVTAEKVAAASKRDVPDSENETWVASKLREAAKKSSK
jgi:hypothetical protein